MGRPSTTWSDDLMKVAGNRWTRAAQDRLSWEFLGKAKSSCERLSDEMITMILHRSYCFKLYFTMSY